MNFNERTERTESVHPIEIALTATVIAVEAVVVLASALVALVATALDQKPVSSPLQSPAPVPFVHPLCALVATELQVLTCDQLRGLAGTRRKFPKHALIGMVAAGV